MPPCLACKHPSAIGYTYTIAKSYICYLYLLLLRGVQPLLLILAHISSISLSNTLDLERPMVTSYTTGRRERPSPSVCVVRVNVMEIVKTYSNQQEIDP